MAQSKHLIQRETTGKEAETSHLLMHREHRQWQSEDALWRDDIAAWQKEVSDAQASLAQVEKALRDHEKALEVHAGAIRCYEQAAIEHEHLLTEFERGDTGEKLLALVKAHQQASEKHAQQRAIHERIKKHHHAVIAGCNALLKSLASM